MQMFRPAGLTNFDKLLDKATSNLLLEVDLLSIISICDLIRQKDCPPKYAVAAIKKKLGNANPHVVYFALQVLESIVKNCGSPVHDEVATREFMDYLRELFKSSPHENVRDKILELVQAWSHAFRKLPSYRSVQDVFTIMKAEGAKFPPLAEADAMFCADTAPEWQDGEKCNRCRTEFGIMNRKHHCRACGQIFCAKCSSKLATLPRFGIEKEVRVCDSCYETYGKESGELIDDPVEMLMRASRGQSAHKAHSNNPPKDESNSGSGGGGGGGGKSEEELAEEEQLQLALAISQSEAEAKEREKFRPSSMPLTTTTTRANNSNSGPETASSPQPTSILHGNSRGNSFEKEDPELARYLDRAYWEQKQTKEQGKEEESGNNALNIRALSQSPFQPSAPIKEVRSGGEQGDEIEEFMTSLRGQIEVFTNRMRSNSNRGRHISNDSSVQSLFMIITRLHSQLIHYIEAQENWREYYEKLQDKLGEVRATSEAVCTMRSEERERKRRESEEAERARAVAMSLKLSLMRQQKQALLQAQRDVALRRVQEEEEMMQMRIDQQRMAAAAAASIQPYGQPPGQMYMGQQPGPPGQYMNQQYGQFPFQPPNPYMIQQPPHPHMQMMMGQMGHQMIHPPNLAQNPQQGQMIPPGNMGQNPQLQIGPSGNLAQMTQNQQGQMGQPGNLAQIPQNQQGQMGQPGNLAQIPQNQQQGQMGQPGNLAQIPQNQHQGQMGHPGNLGQIPQGQMAQPGNMGQIALNQQGQMGLPGNLGQNPQMQGQNLGQIPQNQMMPQNMGQMPHGQIPQMGHWAMGAPQQFYPENYGPNVNTDLGAQQNQGQIPTTEELIKFD